MNDLLAAISLPGRKSSSPPHFHHSQASDRPASASYTPSRPASASYSPSASGALPGSPLRPPLPSPPRGEEGFAQFSSHSPGGSSWSPGMPLLYLYLYLSTPVCPPCRATPHLCSRGHRLPRASVCARLMSVSRLPLGLLPRAPFDHSLLSSSPPSVCAGLRVKIRPRRAASQLCHGLGRAACCAVRGSSCHLFQMMARRKSGIISSRDCVV